SILDLSIDGNDLWAASAYGVQLYDRQADPPAIVASVPVSGVTRLVRAANGVAYVASGSILYVMRKNGHAIELVRSMDIGGTANDLLLLAPYLYVAATNGITQISLLDPLNPAVSNGPAVFPTSGTNVFALAVDSGTLYAADGDSSVEVFSIGIQSAPQKIGTLQSLPRSISVRTNNGKLFVSDGQNSEIFIASNSAKAGSFSAGSTSLAPVTGDVVFVSGTDRVLRTLDLTNLGSAVTLFASALAPNGGTINRISALATAGSRLYAAAGDIGLQVWDTTSFISPYPLHAFSFGSMTSVVSLGTSVYASTAGGGLLEMTQSSSGILTPGRTWHSGSNDTVQDGGDGFLLTSSGKTLTFWTLVSTSPAVISSALFSANVVSAVRAGPRMYAALADGTFWSADLAQTTPAPQLISVGIKVGKVARTGSAVILADDGSSGTTSVRYFASTDFTATPRVATVDGISAAGIAAGPNAAALFTFRGISVIDFSSSTPAVALLPQSNTALPRSLALDGTRLLELTDTALIAWDTTSRKVTAQYPLPSDPVSMNVAAGAQPIADIATLDGVTTVAYASASRLPRSLSSQPGNAYYKKVAAGADRIYLFDGSGIDIFTTSTGTAPRWAGGIRDAGGIIDMASGAAGFYTIGTGAVVSSFSPAGTLMAQATILEGSDVQPLAIVTVGAAVWVSISKGCLSSGCEKKTLVFDRTSLVETTTFSGGVVDVAVSGTRAYAIVDLPAEVRVFDISDPLHPVQIASRATEGPTALQSIAFAAGTVYVLGDKLYGYADSATLPKVSEQLGSYVIDPNGVVKYVDQRVAVDGGCGLIAGRAFSPQFYATGTAWTPGTSIAVPAAVRSVAAKPGTLYLLTDDSLEILATTTQPKPPRRQATR
ncbi:MAG TPA: WD40 repeat domain-containing protein, partial [Thermoanaerobaculia bacterium]|nr:WD40 repeat domain-containing protein [Thermoanaerobaculia bacterium]